MSEDPKPRDYGKYLSSRNKSLDTASAAINLVNLYDKNEVEVIKCIYSRKCFPKGKHGRNTHKKEQKTYQVNGNGQKTQCAAYCRMQKCKPAENLRELQQNQKPNKSLAIQVLPKVTYSKYNSKPISKEWNEFYEEKYKIKPSKCTQEKVSKIYPKKLSTQSNWRCVSVSVASSAMMQTSNDPYEQSQTQLKLPTPKANIRSYEKTVAVYSVYDQIPKCKIPKCKNGKAYLGSGTSFSVQFYKSMGDGRPMCRGSSPAYVAGDERRMSRGGLAYMPGDGFRSGPGHVPGDGRHMSRGGPANVSGDGRQIFSVSPVYLPGDGRQTCRGSPAYILVPQNCSTSRLRRDEDGFICASIPQDDYCYNHTKCCEDGFLKRYFRILMKEKKRCICGKQHHNRQFCPYRFCRRNVGLQCKCNNAAINFLGNDAACQCKCKENREHRPDRDSFYRERGITCRVPQIQTQCSRCSFENMFSTFCPQRQEMERQTVNIGSNFSFKMGFYKRDVNKQPNPNNCCCYNIPACNEPPPPCSQYMPCGGDKVCGSYSTVSSCCQPQPCSPCCSNPKLKCKSSSTKSAGRVGDSCRCSQGKSSGTICVCSPPPPDRCYSPCIPPSFVPCKSTKMINKNKAVGSKRNSKPILVSCSNNKICDIKPLLVDCGSPKKDVGICCSTCILPIYTASKICKLKNASCCEEKPILVECTNEKKIGGVCCGTICNIPVLKQCNKIKNIGCRCDIKPIIIKCVNKRKSIEICCSKCKRPKKTEKYCCCDNEQKSPSILSLIFKNRSGCCCETSGNNEPSFFHNFFKNRGSRCKKCNSLSHEPLVVTRNAQCGCKCQKIGSDFDYKKVVRSMTTATERRRQARAQQCPCKGNFDYRKLFGRLLLYNVHEESCCSSETCGKDNNSPFSKSVGIGEADLRKPPCQLKANSCPLKNKSSYYLKKIFCRLIKQETVFVRQQRMFDPLNQSVAAVQHSSTSGLNERLAKDLVICRNQGSSVPKCKQLTLKDCENAAGASPAEAEDPDKKTIRLGSSCSFSVELYRGSPPSKSCKPCPPCSPCPPPCAESPPADCGASSSAVCDECETPSVPFVQKAFANMILRKKKHLANKSTTCLRCNKCTKVPLIKRGFAQLLLTDSKQRKRNRVCQKTNTLQPVRRVVKRRPGSAAGSQGKTKCDPYVCLKRINQSRCCNKPK